MKTVLNNVVNNLDLSYLFLKIFSEQTKQNNIDLESIPDEFSYEITVECNGLKQTKKSGWKGIKKRIIAERI